MRDSTRFAFLLGLLTMAPIAARAQAAQPDDSATRAAVARELLTVMGAGELALAAMEAQLPALKEAMPNVPPAFWTEFVASARRDVAGLIELMVPGYTKFTVAELNDLLTFYRSPTGRRLVQLQPELTRFGAEAGQRWGAEVGRKVGERTSAPKP